MKNPNERTFFLNATTKEELEDHLKLLKENKAIGLNSVPTKIRKIFRKIMSQPLVNLLNLVFHDETFPDVCKIAKIIPLRKKSSSLDCNTYRPISLLYNIRKIIETLLHTRLYSFLEQSIYSLVSEPYIQQICTDYYNGTNSNISW